MARNILITLGLVSIPVKADKATEDVSTGFHNLCAQGHDPARTYQSLKCSSCGNDDRKSFVKGRPTEDGTGYLVADPDELKQAGALPDKVKQQMALAAHPRDDVMASTVVTGKVYNLLPGKGVDPAQYATVVEAVRRAEADGTALCTTWAYRDVPSMYLVQARKHTLVAHEIAWPEAVRVVAPVEGEANEALVGQFTSLIGMSAAPFDPEAYRDFRAQSIEDLMATKQAVASGDPASPDSPQPLAAGGSNMADQLAAALAAAQTKPDFTGMKKAELVSECESRGLPVSGTKADLLERLAS